jgi:hypothetical protein
MIAKAQSEGKMVLFGKVFRKVQSEDFDNFILRNGSVLFFSETLAQDFCKGFVVFFCHGVILIYFVVRVKLFFEVCANFFSTRRAQVIQKKLSEFFVMAHNGLITFDAHDAEATRSDFPDLAFLWWFLFHAFNLSEKLILSTGFFIF